MMSPRFLVYIWIYFIPLFLICNKSCKVWEASEPDNMKHCVYSGCVLHLLAGAVGRYLRAWVTSARLLLPGPARDLRTDWGRNGFCFSWNRLHSGTYSGQRTNKPTVDFPKCVCSHSKLDFTFKLQGSNVRLLLRNCGFFVTWCYAKVIPHYLYADKVIFCWYQ